MKYVLIAILEWAFMCGTGYADPSGGNGAGAAPQVPAMTARHSDEGQTSGQGKVGKPVLARSGILALPENRTADQHTMTHPFAILQPGVIQPARPMLKEENARGTAPAAIGGPPGSKITTIAAINGTSMKRKP